MVLPLQVIHFIRIMCAWRLRYSPFTPPRGHPLITCYASAMSRKNPFKILSQRSKGSDSASGSSSQPPLSSTSSESSHVPQINITGPQVPRDHDNTHSDRHGLPTESYPELTVAGQAMPSMNRDSKKSESLMGRVFGRVRRKLSPNRSRPSTPNLVEPSRPATPLQPSGNDAVLPSFPFARGEKIDNLRETSGSYATHDNGLSVHAQLEHKGINVPSSEPTITRSASSGSDRKVVIIGATRLILQNAASALKFAPIPNLDAIPDLLLKWLDVYETVGGNDESLKGLDDDILKAYDTVLEPLALSTDPIPDEVVVLIRRFHSALEEQKQRIDALTNQGSVKRTILAPEISTRISDVKACINDAVNNFSVRSHRAPKCSMY
ncbi:uncharacterized protein EI90DRAFT_2426325 [Cantharellus anzutake]|uniref:uncharacterized protein n=1 Tax=Cantharellus anzutake TaxID=1750568 RepID=UPI001906691E|nr:uncharacterized protein EI90DRAFT_2426325 [Cantharellus anzutake]KAF8338884.1 hypothetical protein EI90DRAFT_2426325 [Cantharellus anzutake]